MDAVYRVMTSLFMSLMSAIGIQSPPMTWEIQTIPPGRDVSVMIRTSPHSNHGETLPVEKFDGLKPLLQVDGPAKFRLKRDAGTFEFDGVLRRGSGGGTLEFVPSETFPNELAKRGFARPTADEMFKMAWHDTGFSLIDELAAQKYQKPTLEQLINAGDHGIDRVYVREITALVKDVRTVDALIRQHDHGINETYIRGLASVGLKDLSANDLVRAHDHGISPEYARKASMKRFFRKLSLDELVSLHDHGQD